MRARENLGPLLPPDPQSRVSLSLTGVRSTASGLALDTSGSLETNSWDAFVTDIVLSTTKCLWIAKVKRLKY